MPKAYAFSDIFIPEQSSIQLAAVYHSCLLWGGLSAFRLTCPPLIERLYYSTDVR